jgi:hypothetical protein
MAAHINDMVTLKFNSITRAKPGMRLEAANGEPPAALLTDSGTGSDNKKSSQPTAPLMSMNRVKNIHMVISIHKNIPAFLLTATKSDAIFMISF